LPMLPSSWSSAIRGAADLGRTQRRSSRRCSQPRHSRRCGLRPSFVTAFRIFVAAGVISPERSERPCWCSAQAHRWTAMPKQHLDPAMFLGKELPEHAEYTIVRPLDEGLNAAVFVAHSDLLA